MTNWICVKEKLPNDGDMVQVLCEVTPKENTDRLLRACELQLSIGDHATGDKYISIGFVTDDLFPDELEELPVKVWQVAGYNMSQDCFWDAHLFNVIAWQPMATHPEVTPC